MNRTLIGKILLSGCVNRRTVNADHISVNRQRVARPVGCIRPETGCCTVPGDIEFNNTHIENNRVILFVPNQTGGITAVVGYNQVEGLEIGCGYRRGTGDTGKLDQWYVLSWTGISGHIHQDGLTGIPVNLQRPGTHRVKAVGSKVEPKGYVRIISNLYGSGHVRQGRPGIKMKFRSPTPKHQPFATRSVEDPR